MNATHPIRRSRCVRSVGVEWGVSGVDNRALGALSCHCRSYLPVVFVIAPWPTCERSRAIYYMNRTDDPIQANGGV